MNCSVTFVWITGNVMPSESSGSFFSSLSSSVFLPGRYVSMLLQILSTVLQNRFSGYMKAVTTAGKLCFYRFIQLLFSRLHITDD